MAYTIQTKSQVAQQSVGIDGTLADFSTFDWLSLLDPVNSLIIGSRHDDVLSARAEGDIVLGLAGNDHLDSAFNRTALIGGSGDDTLTTNIIVALQGDAPLHGLAIQFGGTGNDDLNATVTLQGGITPQSPEQVADVLLNGGTGNDTISATANVALPVLGDVTVRTDVIGGSGNDTINAVADGRNAFGNSIALNIIDGGSGNDHVTAHAETEFSALHGTASNVLFGGTGNDELNANAEGVSNQTDLVTNELHGGRGNDVLHALNLTDSNAGTPVGINQLWGDDGDDTLEASHSTDGENAVTDVTNYLDGGSGNDSLIANSTALGGFVHALNQLEGGTGRDNLTAHLDAVAHGGFGPAQALYDVANVLNGGAGDDQLTAFLSATPDPAVTDNSTAENRLNGGAGNDVLTATVAPGSLGSSFLTGGTGNDQLTVFGGSGNVLNGGDGNDTLVSGIGNDGMFGGYGADTFVFAAQNGHDTADFQEGRDKIDLTALGANDIHALDDLSIEVTAGDTIIHFDANNDLTIAGIVNLSANDFLFA
ncbi:calcium-binding protein [Bradyrhizobium sp. 1(2017)]|uniref:calcium-binding protein n=1 Tax=Bradyrhizobium sp. 1(2017) TaxID=1404888 RepID=UPI00140F3BBE|nr:calcium-binding protein [Bradyrhizobium sp. 1(2017)]QIO34574.1 calcium-binding protein [Bradyrhizobium sp. 1(2017)]